MSLGTERIDLTTPRGAQAHLIVRHNTSDLSLAGSFFTLWGKIDDEYRLAETHVSGVFLDVGAHIGLVTVAVLLDNPDATAICLEPLAENLDLLSQNMDANGLTSRVRMLQGAIAKGADEVTIHYGIDSDNPLAGEAFIGGLQVARPINTKTVTVPAFTLAELVEMAGGEVDLLKIDCEGCEWDALRDPAVAHVRQIVGEWHGHPVNIKPRSDGGALLAKAIRKTHTFEDLDHKGGAGTFRAVAR